MEKKTTVISEEELQIQREFCEKIKTYWESRGITPVAYIDTYGCQQNEADSERLRGMLETAGYGFMNTEKGADVVIMNTCAVREHAEDRVFGNLGALSHSKKAHPDQKIFLCGCMAGQPEVAARLKKSFPYVSGVFNAHHLWKFPEILYTVLTKNKRVFETEDSAGNIAEGIPVHRTNHLKGWVSIMYGCNNFCTYCIVPYVRGRERSRMPEDVIAEFRGLVDAGYKDITLLGQNVNSYGKDLEIDYDFADLLAACAAIPGDYLIRFMTSHPKDANEKLFRTIAANPHIAHQFHLPFQSGNDRILKAMNRHYDRQTYLEKVRLLRSYVPDVVLTSDVIVGFPGETEEEFEDTVSLIREVGYDALFTFIFSPRPGTIAAKMPDPIPREEKNRWFERLCTIQNEISAQRHAAYVNQEFRVLIDGIDGDCLTSRTGGGRLVRIKGDPALIGTFRKVRITESTTWSLVGEIID